jgi:lysylphosphatidylglycerol synthetase-like protein (DUF2156 family)
MANIFSTESSKGFESAVSKSDGPLNIVVNILTMAIEFLSVVGGSLCLLMLVYAGFRMVTSFGNEDVFNAEMKRVKNAIIGLVVALLAYTIVELTIGVADKILK